MVDGEEWDDGDGQGSPLSGNPETVRTKINVEDEGSTPDQTLNVTN